LVNLRPRVEAYNAAFARGGARIYKSIAGDFDKKVYSRDDLGDVDSN